MQWGLQIQAEIGSVRTVKKVALFYVLTKQPVTL